MFTTMSTHFRAGLDTEAKYHRRAVGFAVHLRNESVPLTLRYGINSLVTAVKLGSAKKYSSDDSENETPHDQSASLSYLKLCTQDSRSGVTQFSTSARRDLLAIYFGLR